MHDLLFYTVFFIVVVLFFVCVYQPNGHQNLKCIISTVDGEIYCVRERRELKRAANLLAQATNKCKQLVLYVGDKYPHKPEIQRLVERFDPRVISETLPTSEHTAYTENKGDAMAFCLNRNKGGNNKHKLIDLNTLTFVAIHELSHIMTVTEGHKQIFWENFKFLLTCAVDADIYHPVDYKKDPQPYCGMQITDNPHFDM